jgi:hypothetical protein
MICLELRHRSTLLPSPLNSTPLQKMPLALEIEDRRGKVLTTVSLSEGATTDDLKRVFAKEFPRYGDVNRQLFTTGVDKDKITLKPDQTLAKQGIITGDKIVFKDLGPQISW